MPKSRPPTKTEGITRERLLVSPWPGFTVPRYTQVPDEVFDVLMPILTEAEFKCLCYICRRTFGFRKDADAISLNQMATGIKTKEGKVIDRGTGLSKASVKNALSFLTKAGIVDVQKRISEEGEYETNVYSLRIRATPPATNPGNSPSEPGVGQNLAYPRPKSNPVVGQNITHPRPKSRKRVGQNLAIQDREVQDTDNNNSATSPTSVDAADMPTRKTALQASLVELGVSPRMAKHLVARYPVGIVQRAVEYLLYRLAKGWRPKESPPAWLVSAVTEGWEIPSWFKTADEVAAESAKQTRAEEEGLRLLDQQRKWEEAKMVKARGRSLRSLGIAKGTDLLWTKVNEWLRERNLWRPALSTAVLARVTEEYALVLCGYPFSLEMVRGSAAVIGQALEALTGRAVEVEVGLEPTLFEAAE